MMTDRQDVILPKQGSTSSRRTRFAPSPTGHLHIGHAYSALCAWHYAGYDAANFILRIDDLDYTRCRPDYVSQITSDLSWLGLSWASEPVFQSARLAQYATALKRLQDLDLVYPCYLSRTEIGDLLSAPHGPSSFMPSTRTSLSDEMRRDREDAGQIPAWRLDSKKAIATAGPLTWQDSIGTEHAATPEIFGDVVIARRDIQASYHLSVVIDDYTDGIDLVVRGADLKEATHLHRLLQALLSIPAPLYQHHELICDDAGKRLAKRDDAKSLIAYRDAGLTLAELQKMMPVIR